MKLKISAIALVSLVSSPAFAGEAGTNYIGIQHALATYEDDLGLESDPTMLVGRFGHFVNDNFSVEARAGFGLSDDDVEWNGYATNATAEIDSLFGVYGVGHLPLNEKFSVYGLVGFTQGEASIQVGSVSESDDDSGFSYGIGGQFNFTPTIAGTVEYVSYLDKSDYEISAISAGVNFQF